MDGRLQNAIAKIEVVRDGVVISRGTASLVGGDRVITALHVVADRSAALRHTPQAGRQPVPARTFVADLADGRLSPWLIFEPTCVQLDVNENGHVIAAELFDC